MHLHGVALSEAQGQLTFTLPYIFIVFVMRILSQCPQTDAGIRRTVQIFFFFQRYYEVKNGSGAHLASYQMGTRRTFPGGKTAGE
jgi:hypothetical protein